MPAVAQRAEAGATRFNAALRVELCCCVLIALLAAPVGAQQSTVQQLRIIAPAAPGGGWDQTARVMQQALQHSGLARTVSVENVPGAAGTIGLAKFMGTERGNGDALMISGLIMLGGIVMHRSPVTLDDVTPIARLTGEYEVIAVPASSPLRSMADLIGAMKSRPEAVSWGGGSAGGSDQILAGLVADAAGVPAARINYVAFAGGGESLAAVVGGQVSVGVSGLAEFAPHIEAGTIRALGISSGTRLPGLDVPTLREQGINVEFENWRSVVAPPAITAADRARLESIVAAMAQSQPWRDALARYRWIDRYLAGRELEAFVDSEETRVERILRQIGGTQQTRTSRAYPLFVLAGLVIAAFAMVVRSYRTRRSSTARTAASEKPGAAAWTPIVLLTVGIVLNLALAERAGFIIASAILFWCTARAFDSRHAVRDAIFAIAIAAGAYLLFSQVLQLQLPSGPLAHLF